MNFFCLVCLQFFAVTANSLHGSFSFIKIFLRCVCPLFHIILLLILIQITVNSVWSGGLVNVRITTQYMPCVPDYLTVGWKSTKGMGCIGGSRKGVPDTRPPWDPILSFLHTFSPKSAHVGGPRPPPPPQEILDPPLDVTIRVLRLFELCKTPNDAHWVVPIQISLNHQSIDFLAKSDGFVRTNDVCQSIT